LRHREENIESISNIYGISFSNLPNYTNKFIFLLIYKYPLSKKSTFGTFILAMTLVLTMVISAIDLSNPIQLAASTAEENKDKENKNEEKEERKADGQGNDGAEEEEQEPNGDEEEGAQEGDADVDQELLSELRDEEDLKGSGDIQEEETEGDLLSELRGGETTKQAPIAISGENVYTVWWTNNTANGNDEVMFRASADGGTIFGNKTNLSNTTGADSVDAMIDAEGGNVVITWWERNQTINEPVMRISNDNGATFGPMLVLATNGTIGGPEEE
jgi:hypothetical protein